MICVILIPRCRFEDSVNRLHYLGCRLCHLGHRLPIHVERCAILYLYSAHRFGRNSLGISNESINEIRCTLI